jgi:hypothetical protein
MGKIRELRCARARLTRSGTFSLVRLGLTAVGIGAIMVVRPLRPCGTAGGTFGVLRDPDCVRSTRPSGGHSAVVGHAEVKQFCWWMYRCPLLRTRRTPMHEIKGVEMFMREMRNCGNDVAQTNHPRHERFTAYGLVLCWCNASESAARYQSHGRVSPKIENAKKAPRTAKSVELISRG